MMNYSVVFLKSWNYRICERNITWNHYINTTWVAREIPNFFVPTNEELFGETMNEKELFEI
ncbi:hypothetical protein J2Y03_004571 [Neobacillus niacini]|nr:hypothetical protein [Neobacillus niacini]